MHNKGTVVLLAIAFFAAPRDFMAQPIAKQQAAKESRTERFDTQPFRGDLDVVPKQYRGHDPHALAVALAGCPVKNEFETTAQHKQKLDAWSSRPLYGDVKVDDLIAIAGYYVSLDKEYDADTQAMDFSFSPTRQVSAEDYSRPYLIIDQNKKVLSPVNGQTAMGVKFAYERKAYIEFGVKFQNLSHNNQKYTFPAAPAAAKGNMLWGVLYIGTLAEPYTFSEEGYHTPSLSERYEQLVKSRGIVLDLEEILVYELPSGKILARVPVQ